MNRFQMLYQKVLSGEACCMLEAQEGTGCEFGCPYAGPENCEKNLEKDVNRLHSLMKLLDELVDEEDIPTN